jgi:hypothetical protein
VQPLLAAVSNALPGAVAINFTVSNDPWDIFEAYTFAVVVDAARSDGYAAHLEALHVSNPPLFVFRKGPGSIWSTKFSFVRLSYGTDTELETHLGTRIEGQSGVAHEADVSVIQRAEGVHARNERYAPRAQSCVLAFECKYYDTSIGLDILREFLGLTTDLRSKHVRQWLVTNVSHPDLPAFLKHHNRDWADNVLPSSAGEKNLQQQVESAFHRFRR